MSLQQILEIQKDRKKRCDDIYQKIMDRVRIRINHTAKYGGTNCFYDIPQLMYGLPSVDLKACGDFIQKKLKKEGFVVYRISDTFFIISWDTASIEYAAKRREKAKESADERQRLDEEEHKRIEQMMSYLINNSSE